MKKLVKKISFIRALNVLVAAAFFTLVSCGKKINDREHSFFSKLESDHLLMEQKCFSVNSKYEPITSAIINRYNDLLNRFPTHFINIPLSSYDYRSPLIIGLLDSEKRFQKIEEMRIDGTYKVKDIQFVVNEIHNLYHSSIRFEAQKCFFSILNEKKKDEVRPYLFFKDFCLEKENDEFCSSPGLGELTKNETKLIEENFIKLCKSFESKKSGSAICHLQFKNARRSQTLSKLLNSYQKRFQTERFNKLFSLTSTHQKFSCEKDGNDRTRMEVKIFNRGISHLSLETLIQFVSATWTKENFILSLTLVEEMGSDVVEVIPTSSGVSYVPDNNPRQIYLSTNLDFETQKKVFAHEFGHVLGFPDCYIEYFDSSKKNLVYYELDNGDNNIMCSIKAGVNVPSSYLKELTQKSCVFP